MTAVTICVAAWLLICLLDHVLAARAVAIREEIRWRIDNPAEAAALAMARFHERIDALTSCGLGEAEAAELVVAETISDLERFCEAAA